MYGKGMLPGECKSCEVLSQSIFLGDVGRDNKV